MCVYIYIRICFSIATFFSVLEGLVLFVWAFDFFSVGDLTDFEIDGCNPNDGGSSDWYFIQPLST